MINDLLVVFIHPTTLISANFGYDQILKPTITNWPTQPNPWTRPVPPRSTTIPNAINELSSRRIGTTLFRLMWWSHISFTFCHFGSESVCCVVDGGCRFSLEPHAMRIIVVCDIERFLRCTGWLLGRLPCYWECVSGARSEQFGRCARLPWLDIRLRNVLRWFSAM